MLNALTKLFECKNEENKDGIKAHETKEREMMCDGDLRVSLCITLLL